MTCAVCRREEPASISGDWQFRPNPFLIEAYRATWHEKYGFKKAEVRVRAGQITKVAITYRPEDAEQE